MHASFVTASVSSAAAVDLAQFFTNMIGTLAVILIISAFIGGSDLMTKLLGAKTGSRWKYSLLAGLFGGIFGIYGTLSGLELNGAIISVRDIGPMLAGFTGGPLGGLIAGVISGVHRLLVGSTESMTTKLVSCACIIATVCIGLICGLLSDKFHKKLIKPWMALIVGVVMEAFHLALVLIIVKPFSAALGIVRAIALPFVLVNAVGFTLMITMITYFEKQRTLTLERSRLKTELEVANSIQHSLLPPISESYPGRSEISVAASMAPAKEVGGDFYDVFFVDKSRIAFVVADVSGKGIPAALFMATSKIVIQNCVRDLPTLSEAAATANATLCSNNTMDMFVTAWIGVLDLASGQLTFVCAGHNPPVLLSGGRADFIRHRSGLVLAGMEGMKYREKSIELKPGDLLFIYTDGVTEAENASHELFGEERLAACLESSAGMEPEEMIGNVKSALGSHVKGFDQFDDITMLCLSYRGPGEQNE